MPQIFHHSTNALAKITIYGAVFIGLALLWVAAELNRSSWNTGQWVEKQQPVQFMTYPISSISITAFT